MKVHKWFVIGLMSLVFVFALVNFQALAEDEQEDKGVRAQGVIFNIAEDRQIERIGGIYEPEGLDKYLKRKFDAVEGQLEALTRAISTIEKDIAEIKEATQKEKVIMPS